MQKDIIQSVNIDKIIYMKHSMSEFWNFTKKEKKVRGIYCMRLKLKKKTQVVCVPSLELVGFYIYFFFQICYICGIIMYLLTKRAQNVRKNLKHLDCQLVWMGKTNIFLKDSFIMSYKKSHVQVR